MKTWQVDLSVTEGTSRREMLKKLVEEKPVAKKRRGDL